ncbi:MAG TPA: alpha/beta fold hydrolase [Candidatus Limnocylindria bacterium]
MAARYIDVDGSRLCCEVAGSGTPVVLLHGGWLDMRQWDEQFEALAREHTVVRYDARGYGRSPLGVVPYTHHEDLAALLRALGIERPNLVALSNGAAIAVEFAIWAPHSVRSLVVGAAPMRGRDLGPEFITGMRAVVSAGAAGDKDRCLAAAWDFAPLRVAAGLPDARGRIDRMIREHEFAYARPGAPKRGYLDPPISQRFAEITAPTLVVIGDGEMPALLEQGEAMAASIPGAQLAVVAGAGHIVNLEQPVAYDALVSEWLRAH